MNNIASFAAGKLIVVFFCIQTLDTNAQTNIHGKVMDTTGKPISQANVLMLNAFDSVLIKGMLTNETGAFIFENIKPGKYRINATYTGAKAVYSPIIEISSMDKDINLGNILLAETAMELKEVTVVAKRLLYEQKIDRLVINVASAITYSGLTVLDVLERSPGITVNRLAGSLSINGKSGVIIMINGKRNYMDLATVIQLLSGQPSGNVERIEVITTPPANFDAEGNAGVINIVLKSNNKYGTNGSFSLMAGYSKHEQNSASLNINHRKGKVNIFGNYAYSRYHLEQLWTIYRAITVECIIKENYSENNRNALVAQHNGQAGIDVELSKKTILGALVSGNYREWTMQSMNNAVISSNGQIDTTVKVDNNEVHNTLYYAANLNLQHTYKPEEKLTINLDYLHYQDKNPNTYANNYFNQAGDFLYNENVRSNKITPLTFWVGSLDFIRKISKKTDLEAGLKGTTSQSTNDVGVSTLVQNDWITDSLYSGMHNISEKIGAAYSSINLKASEKTSFKFGLRYEYTHTKISTDAKEGGVRRDYGNLFPSFFFLHTIKEDQSINFTYSRRIWRPSFSNLAPYVLFLDPKTFSTGNPALQPAIIDAASTAFTIQNKIITFSYDHIGNIINEVPKIDEVTNKMVTAVQNSKGSQSLSLGLSLPFTISKWFNIQNNLTGIWSQMNAFYKAAVKTETFGYYLNCGQNFLLPRDFSIGLTEYYNSGNVWGLKHIKPSGSVDIGAQKKLAKSKSVLSLNLNNIFNTQTGRDYADIPEQNLMIRNNYTYSYPGISLTYTRNFGNDKVTGKRERSTGAEDEKNRAN